MFVRSRFSHVHFETLFQNVRVDLKFQKRCVLPLGNQRKRNTRVFPQFLPILRMKSFVAILLCRNLNSNTLNFVSVVHRNGS